MTLPPLAAIRVFEAAARLASFTKAAAELGMTQAAVSYQVRVLEERVGTPLFLRKPRQVVLTRAGELLAPRVSEAFAILVEAYAQARGDAQETLRITTVLTFAANWLSPRLGSFQINNPNLAVSIDTGSTLVDFSREEFDVGIRSGSGQWPGLAAHKLLDADFAPMLSPALARSAGPLDHPSDLLRLPLLDPEDPWWEQWFREAGVADPPLAGRPNIRMGSQAYEANAAMAGQGVAMLSRAFFLTELETGRLVQPFAQLSHDARSYWFVYPEARRNVPKIRNFRDWLLAEARRSLGEPRP